MTNLGFRYRLHRNDLPGTPDIVLSKYKKVIMVHGCFWHKHRCPYGQATPKTNHEYWATKFEGNLRRDRRIRKALKSLGWDVLTIWECQTTAKTRDRLERKVAKFLQVTEVW